MEGKLRPASSLDGAVRALEDSFFLERDQALMGQLRALRKMAESKESLCAASGITNDVVLSRLVDLGVKPETVAALATIPLLEVAWADGAISPAERETVLSHANAQGIRPGSVERELLERWLTQRPEPKLLKAWQAYIHGLCEKLNPQERELLKQELLHSTRATARASGGFLGVARVSRQEQDVLDALAAAFSSGLVPSP